jgi:outer membrane protein
MMRKNISIALLAALGAGTCRAQAPAPVAAPTSAPLAASSSASAPMPLTLQDAERMAVKNHPRIQSSESLATAASAQVREARAAYYPTATASLTGVEAESNSRIAAGGLNNPIIYDRYSNGLYASQMITDFGRTHELVKSSNLHAQAQKENVITTRAQVLLGVDQGYFNVLKSQAVLKVAQETVKDRQLVSDQVGALEKNKLKSGLDLSFANVDLSQSQLLLIQAQNDLDAAYAGLSDALGLSDERAFTLIEPAAGADAPPADLTDLIQQALHNRPELIGLQLDVNAAQSYAAAERNLSMPTISAAGVAGLTPYRQEELSSRYAAAGFNVNIPIFNGRLFSALHAEATARAQAQQQDLHDLQNRVVRDVRTAWLNANSAFQRLAVTDQLFNQASRALELADSRYHLGLSSIIELSQAQLRKTEAEIQQASARYDYQSQLAVLNFQIGALH